MTLWLLFGIRTKHAMPAWRRSAALSIVLLSVLFFLASNLAAQSTGRRVALVVGNSSYQKLGKLRNPVNDARDVGHSLEALGFDVELLLDAGLGEMNEAVDRFGRKLAGAEAGLFFYAGHGVQSSGVNYLVPVDADVQAEYQLKYRTVQADLVLDTMNASGCGLNIVVLDACRDNPFASFRSGARGLAMVSSAPAGAIIVYATDPGKTAADGAGSHGAFTEAFLKHIAAPGVDVKELFDKVGADVAAATRQQQTPWVSSKYYGTYYLAGAAPAVPAPPAVTQAAPQPATSAVVAAAKPIGKAELIVRTNPEGATIFSGGTELGEAGDVLSVPAGAELEIVARKGYLVAGTKLLPGPGQLYELDLELKQQKGNVLFKAKEADSGRVFLDGKELGPFGKGLFRDLAAGDHEYAIHGKGFYASGKVLIEPDVTTTVVPSLVDVGSLRVSMPNECSAMAGATGYGPVAVTAGQTLDDLPVGTAKLSASGPGYEAAEAEVAIAKGQVTTWTPWTTGSLAISTQPTGAELWVNGEAVGKAPQTLRGLTPGKVTVTARTEGYEDSTLTAVMTLGKTIPAAVNLTRSVGSLRPLVGDDVTIAVEGAEIGRRESLGPRPMQDLPTGHYRVAAGGPGYEPATGTVLVRRNEETTWQPWATGKLLVESDPPGALVLLRGKEYGTAPVVCEGLSAGSFVPVVVRAEGYEDVALSSNVIGGKTLRVPVKLARSLGTLRLNLPSDGEVVVRSAEIGEQKLIGTSSVSLPTGVYSVEAGGPGFETVSGTVKIDRNVQATWQPWTTGKLLVESEPSGAEIWIGGKVAGIAPITMSGLSAGTVVITAKFQDYEDSSKVVAISVGKTVSTGINMTRSLGRLKVEAPSGTVVQYTGLSEGSLAVAASGSATISLPVGDYAVKAERKDFDPDNSTIKVSKGAETSWAPWSTGSLRIESSPAGADIIVDGVTAGQTPKTISGLQLKTVSVVVKASGYEDRMLQTTVVQGRTTVLPIKLARSVGLLRAIAPSEATISVKNPEIGERKGGGDGAYFSLPTGEYQLEATMPGSQPVVSSIRIERNGDHEWMPWTKGSVRVTSEPPGAKVSIDGVEQGLTPISVEVTAQKKHSVTVGLDRYESYSSDFSVAMGKRTELLARLQQSPGLIRIVTDPPGVTVMLDAVPTNWKVTPCVFDNVAVGDHEIYFHTFSVDEKYYSSTTYTIHVEAGEEKLLEKKLEQIVASLTIIDAYPGSQLFIDGSLVMDPAAFDDGIQLLSGKHEVRLIGPQGQEWTSSVSLFWSGEILGRGYMEYKIPRATIKIDGHLDDWKHIAPVFFPMRSEDQLPKVSGTKISTGYLCCDDKNLYLRVDFSDGLPDPKVKNLVFDLVLSVGSKTVLCSLQSSLFGKVVSIGNELNPSEWYRAGAYAATSSGYEMSFPIDTLRQFYKNLPLPMFAYLRTYLDNGTNSKNPKEGLERSNSQYLGMAF